MAYERITAAAVSEREADLDAVADYLAAGAVVTLSPSHLRVRPLPIRPAT